MKDTQVLQENPLSIIKSTEAITPILSKVEMSGKRTHSKAMEIEEEENLETSKRQNTESEGQLVEVIEASNKKGKGKVKGPSFEIQEYEFSEVSEESSEKLKSKSDLYDQ